MTLGQISFFAGMVDGLSDMQKRYPVNFMDIAGLAWGLYLICFYIYFRTKTLGALSSPSETE